MRYHWATSPHFEQEFYVMITFCGVLFIWWFTLCDIHLFWRSVWHNNEMQLSRFVRVTLCSLNFCSSISWNCLCLSSLNIMLVCICSYSDPHAAKANVLTVMLLPTGILTRMMLFAAVLTQEAKYVEGWPSTTSAWAGWSRFDIPVDRYGGVHSLLICTSSPLGFPTCHRAG